MRQKSLLLLFFLCPFDLVSLRATYGEGGEYTEANHLQSQSEGDFLRRF